jgi:hypothetical protein
VVFTSTTKTSVQNLIEQPQKGSKLGTIQQISDFRTEPNAVKALSASPTLNKFFSIFCVESSQKHFSRFVHYHIGFNFSINTQTQNITEQPQTSSNTAIKLKFSYCFQSENLETQQHHFEPLFFLGSKCF